MAIKKTATYGEYVINIASNNSVTVLKNGNVCDVAKAALREIAAFVGFDVDAKWTTQQLGTKLVDAINKGVEVKADKVEKEVKTKVQISANNDNETLELIERYSNEIKHLETELSVSKSFVKEYEEKRARVRGGGRGRLASSDWDTKLELAKIDMQIASYKAKVSLYKNQIKIRKEKLDELKKKK